MADQIQRGRSPTRAQRGLIASPHYLASSTGINILREGGSAVDAAIAANATLCVVYPHMAGLGGDGFWLIADDEEVRAINASGPAASAATQAYYADLGYNKIPQRGGASALTVPGVVDGWRKAHEEYGALKWNQLFRDAITYAQEGVPVTDNLGQWINRDKNILKNDSLMRETYLSSDSAPETGEMLRQQELGKSIEAIAEDGPRSSFYDGFIAEEFCEGLGDESPLTVSDFSEYTAEWVNPISVTYRGYTAYSLPPNTQGVAALQILGILNEFDVESWNHLSADYYHYLTDVTKVAFADRDAWVTDPTCIDFPSKTLLSSSYLAGRRELIRSDQTLSAPVQPGIRPNESSSTGYDASGDTCYLSVVDKNGMAVSMIQSIYHDFGSGIIAGNTGIIPQNRGTAFSLNPNHINSLEPNKRTFHTLTPSLMTRSGQPWLIYGTMGGEGQPQTQAALVTRLVDFGLDVQTAIEAPRFLYGRTWGQESKSLSLESRVPDGIVNELEQRGHNVSMVRDFDEVMGHSAVIKIHADCQLEGGADPRSDGSAIGY